MLHRYYVDYKIYVRAQSISMISISRAILFISKKKIQNTNIKNVFIDFYIHMYKFYIYS